MVRKQWHARLDCPCGNVRGARRRQVTANMEQLLKSGVLGSPEDALATLLEAFSSMVFDPELVKEGKSVVRLHRLLRAAWVTQCCGMQVPLR